MAVERQPRSGEGRLPTFLIIGAPKAGTASLASNLAEHPDVFMPDEKELYFFTRNWGEGLGWYRHWFAGAGSARAVGEATPTYMYQKRALERMRTVLPDVKLIAVLRHPVDRAYSAYWWLRETTERRSFEQAVRDELADPASLPNSFRYLETGRYLGSLERIDDYFPRERLRVAILERLRSSADEAFAEVCRFLGVDEAAKPANLESVIEPAYGLRLPRPRLFRRREGKRASRIVDAVDRGNRKPLRYPAMDETLRAELIERFEDDNARLGAWLGEDLSSLWT